MSRLSYKEIRSNTISAQSLQRLFTVVKDDRTAALAVWLVTIFDADKQTLGDILNGIKTL